MNRILVGTDFSAAALLAVDRAADIARSLGHELVIVSAVEVPRLPLARKAAAQGLVEELQGWARGQLAEEAERVSDGDLHVSTELRLGPAAGELARVAESPEVHLVVVGARGARAGKGVLGSVPVRLAQTCRKPVLIVPEPL